jgi:hypothetical protein
MIDDGLFDRFAKPDVILGAGAKLRFSRPTQRGAIDPAVAGGERVDRVRPAPAGTLERSVQQESSLRRL